MAHQLRFPTCPWIVVGSFAWLAAVTFCPVQAKGVDFAREIQPIFAQHCLECHGPDQQEGGFRLDERESATSAAESGEQPIAPGKPAASELLRRVASTDPNTWMPPEGERLTKAEVAQLSDWIASGAKYTQHWAYRPLEKPRFEPVSNPAWCANAIDYFVLQKLKECGLQPSPIADRYTLIRRLYYDLLGLPPTIAAVDAFVRDKNPEAYERLVDRLLASPHFGERWGRHWLDKARYADSDGYEKDNPRPNAWNYRDWVIASINHDLPFDQFTIEQLAGDLLPDASDSQKLATAFNRQTLTNTEGGTDKEEWRVAAVMDRTETLGAVWLGLTVGCARCHSHKFDAISQDEYYQLYAFFNNGDETEAELTAPSRQKAKVRVISQRTRDPRTTNVLHRGDFLQPKHVVPAGTLAALPSSVEPESAKADLDRLDMARWLVDGNNPLPPRVVVNQIWQHLFGEGLVRTMNDFGIRGEPPTHPQLLDWLALEFTQNGWSRKHVIRTILLSNTYRQASRHREELVDVDPTNRWLHRQNRFRVEAEILRDITLAASGLLTARVGGPSVFPPIPPSITDLTYNSGFQWKTSQGEDRYRRGMYTFFKRTAPHPNLTTFDCPSSNITNIRRETSNTPIGALVTLNNEVYVEAARALGQRVLAASGMTDDERLCMLWRLCLARPIHEAELSKLRGLLDESKHWYEQHRDEAARLIGAEGSPDGTDVELAAWIAVARVALNLDEFITRQ